MSQPRFPEQFTQHLDRYQANNMVLLGLLLPEEKNSIWNYVAATVYLNHPESSSSYISNAANSDVKEAYYSFVKASDPEEKQKFSQEVADLTGYSAEDIQEHAKVFLAYVLEHQLYEAMAA